MEIEKFLEQFVEGYLFRDLESMASLPDRGRYGNCGYSMVLVACTGIELFGALTYERGRQQGDTYFNAFWATLYKTQPARAELGELVRKLVRDGIAHVFIARPNVTVWKQGDAQTHLTTDANGFFNIDALCLFEDLKRAYHSEIRPRLEFGAARARLQARLDILRAQATSVSERPLFVEAAGKLPVEPHPAFPIIPSGESTLASISANSTAWPPAQRIDVSQIPQWIKRDDRNDA
jgi:hypothetical protein